jgi:uncharacterized protein YdeI (YjbR/CyaY-like superfamily)
MDVEFFKTQDDFLAWLEEHHDRLKQQWVGYYKKTSGRQSITYPESVDAALCYGWIDGLKNAIDGERYKIRFTPRKSVSIWSAVNIKRVAELQALGKMRPAGLQAFQLRKENKSGIYSYEQRSVDLDSPYADQLKQNQPAWEFYQTQTDYYRRAVNWWVVSAKTEETRLKRLEQLIEFSAMGEKIPAMSRTKKATS